MPIFWPAASGDVPAVGDPALDLLLEGSPLPEDAAGSLRTAADVLAALASAPAVTDPAAEADARAMFRGAIGVSDEPTRSHPRRRPLLTSLLSAKIIAATAATAVTLGGGAVAAAAYTGSLPASVQQFAHNTIGAPQPTHTPTPVGPDANGHSAYGLCTAYAHLKAHGSAKQKAVAFRNLAAAAGGAANVASYCAGVAHPGASPTSTPTGRPTAKPTHPAHPTGKPTALPTHPTGRPTSRPSHVPTTPSARPTSHPTGQPTAHPTAHPTSHPTGQPTAHPTAHPTSGG